jgi:anaerobic selenocysteine-containing dehydrogenase
MDHGGCGLRVGIKNNRIVEITGDPQGVLNHGFLCAKGRASADRLYHPLRLKQPLKRRGPRGSGQWDPISWSEALTVVGDQLNRIKSRHGARAVAFCQGMPKGLEHFVLIRLANLFGSPNVVAVQDVCHAPREITGIHTCGFYPVADYDHPSDLVMLWGSNITATNEEGQICSRFQKQIDAGAELIVVDPRRIAAVSRARYWLQLKPGTDTWLALAFLNVIIGENRHDRQFVEQWTHGFSDLAAHAVEFTPERAAEITRVPADLIRKSARAYAAARPAAIGWGNAIEQNCHAFDTVRALVCLMAVCGNLDVPGGNIQAVEPKILPLREFVRADCIPGKKKEMLHASQGTLRGLMTVPPAYLRKAILEASPYAVRGAYMQCTNPLVGYADSRQTFAALMKLDFLSVSDVFMTPTAALADIVLPAATHFEFNDIGHYGLGHGIVLARPKVVDPPQDCRPDIQILNELGKSVTDRADWPEDYQDLLADVLAPAGLSYAEFAQRGYLRGTPRFRKYRDAGFATSTGKVELALNRAALLKVAPLPEINAIASQTPDYPLTLTSAKSPVYLHSSYRWLEKLRQRSPHPRVRIHPQTAETYGIREGHAVLIETPWGRIQQTACLSDDLHRDVVYADYGWWFPEDTISPQFDWQSANYNMLTSTDTLGPAFGTPNLKGIPCRIRPK